MISDSIKRRDRIVTRACTIWRMIAVIGVYPFFRHVGLTNSPTCLFFPVLAFLGGICCETSSRLATRRLDLDGDYKVKTCWGYLILALAWVSAVCLSGFGFIIGPATSSGGRPGVAYILGGAIAWLIFGAAWVWTTILELNGRSTVERLTPGRTSAISTGRS